jgi:hypothetical protein
VELARDSRAGKDDGVTLGGVATEPFFLFFVTFADIVSRCVARGGSSQGW